MCTKRYCGEGWEKQIKKARGVFFVYILLPDASLCFPAAAAVAAVFVPGSLLFFAAVRRRVSTDFPLPMVFPWRSIVSGAVMLCYFCPAGINEFGMEAINIFLLMQGQYVKARRCKWAGRSGVDRYIGIVEAAGSISARSTFLFVFSFVF